MPFGPTHSAIRQLATWAVHSFYSEVLTVNAEAVPRDGPILVASNHHNMTVDPAVLSVTFPYGRKLHYWAKSTIFKNPVANYILLDAGNLPVDRKTKNNQLLFKGTFDALKLGECVAVFPEGTSYTEPRIMSIKDGIGWTALEYAKNIRMEDGTLSGEATSAGQTKTSKVRDVTVAICGINYVSKSKYRSRILVLYNESVSMTPYVDQFMTPGEEKLAVKRLVAEVETRMRAVTINAVEGEGWDAWHCAKLTRDVLWPREERLPLIYYREIMQELVDLFSRESCAKDPRLYRLKDALLAYHKALRAASLQHPSLATVPFPSSLDPAVPHPLPGRVRAVWGLLKDTARVLFKAPWWLLPGAVHLPLYGMGYLGGKLQQEEEESTAQNKIVVALLFCLFLYPFLFFVAWSLFAAIPLPLSAVIALGFTYLFAVYHVSLLDDTYRSFKRLVASWKVLIGIWSPKAGRAVGVSQQSDGEGESEHVNRLNRGENTVRRVLRLRVATVGRLSAYLNELEREEQAKVVNGQNGLVELLKKRGAKIPGKLINGSGH